MISSLTAIEQLVVAKMGWRCECCGGVYEVGSLEIHHSRDSLAGIGIEGRLLLCHTCNKRVDLAEEVYIEAHATNNSEEPFSRDLIRAFAL
jgi:hypothetical protein